MRSSRTGTLYREYIIDPGLERSTLFEALAMRRPGIETVVYPGCSIHVTPSMYFRHVTYVDRSDRSAQFFTDEPGVAKVIADRSHHSKAPHVQFIHQDFTEPLPVREASFCLPLALYTPGVARATARYLRVGGLLVMDNHRVEAADAMRERNLNLIGSGRTGRIAVDLVSEAPDTPPVETESPQNRSGAPDYYVFERIRDHAGR